MAKAKAENHATVHDASVRDEVEIDRESHVDFEPPDEKKAHLVNVDPEKAGVPRSDHAKEIYALRRGDRLADFVKSRRAGAGAVFDINPYDLHLEPGWNKRNFNTPRRKAKIDEYAQSMKRLGVREPLEAHMKGTQMFVHSGWNRLFAAYHAIEHYDANMKGIPVRLGRAGQNDDDRMLSQIVNNQADPPLPYEQGQVCKEMVNMGWSIEDIAASIGRSATNVKALLDLHELPYEIRRLVDSGQVKAYFATKKWREYDGDKDAVLAQLQGAIEKAASLGVHVMPKHAPDAPARKPRTKRVRGRRIGRSPDGPPALEVANEAVGSSVAITQQDEEAPAAPIARLVELSQVGKVIERNEDENYVLVQFTIAHYEEWAVLADRPDDDLPAVEGPTSDDEAAAA